MDSQNVPGIVNFCLPTCLSSIISRDNCLKRCGGGMEWEIRTVVQSLSCIWLFVTPWTAACQALLSFTISKNLFKFMSIESAMLSDHLVLCHPFSFCLQLFLPPGSFAMTQLFASGGQNIGVSASAPVLPMNSQCLFPLRWAGLISLQSKGLSRVFSSTTIWKHQFFGVEPSLWSNSYIHTWLLEKP